MRRAELRETLPAGLYRPRRAAGVLHDVLEDTDVRRRDPESRFGAAVGDLVAAISDHPSIEYGVCQSYYGYQARRYLLDERSIRALPLRTISARGSDWEMFPVL
jgi:(p)ppGpp synthase/HD superfamily hydrolase